MAATVEGVSAAAKEIGQVFLRVLEDRWPGLAASIVAWTAVFGLACMVPGIATKSFDFRVCTCPPILWVSPTISMGGHAPAPRAGRCT
jgi:hypothetical protein